MIRQKCKNQINNHGKMKECLPNLEESKKEIMIVSFCLGDLLKAKNRVFQSKSYIFDFRKNLKVY